MDPLTLISLIGTLGSSMPGFFMHDNGLRDILNRLYRDTSPNAILGQANDYYKAFLGGPQYTAGRNMINMNANRMSEQIASSNSARGLTGTGIGSVAQALGSNTAGFSLAGLQNQGWQGALQAAMDAAKTRYSGAGYLQAPRNIPQQTYASLSDWFSKLDLHSLFPDKPGKVAPKTGAYGVYNPRPQGNLDIFSQLMARP